MLSPHKTVRDNSPQTYKIHNADLYVVILDTGVSILSTQGDLLIDTELSVLLLLLLVLLLGAECSNILYSSRYSIKPKISNTSVISVVQIILRAESNTRY